MKYIGLLFISIIPILLGAQKKYALLMEEKEKEALIRFFEAVRFEIDSFLRPQKEIFHRYENAILEKRGFLPLLRQEVDQNPCGALFRATKQLLEKEIFSQKEQEALLAFSENFGMQSKNAQISDCDRLLLVLRSEEEKIKEKRKTDASIAWTSGLCLGIGLFILMM